MPAAAAAQASLQQLRPFCANEFPQIDPEIGYPPVLHSIKRLGILKCPNGLRRPMRTRSASRAIANRSRVHLQGPDNSISFVLARRPSGLFVERTRHRTRERQVLHAFRFADEPAFLRWCNADRLQFTYPLLYSQLRRTGCELICSDLEPDQPLG